MALNRKLILAGFLGLFLLAGCQAKNQPVGLERLDYPSSLESLLDRFEGQLVYIDVMASWCKPCLEELPRYADSEEFFRKHGIVKLFISIDGTPEEIDRCAESIESHNLSGYYATYAPPSGQNPQSSFPHDVEPFFISYDNDGNMTGMSVPQYLIVDKEGNIVERKAKRPSDPESLQEQLSLYL